MADARMRKLEREAATGSVEAQATLERELVRVGILRGPTACSRCTGRGMLEEMDSGVMPMLDRRPCPSCDGTGRAPYEDAIGLRAYCGDEVARRALGIPDGCWVGIRGTSTLLGEPVVWDDSPDDDRADASLGDWAAGLSTWGRDCRARAALAAASEAVNTWGEAEGRRRGVTISTESGETVPPSALTADGLDGLSPGWGRPYRAVEAAEEWASCPCPEHASAARIAASQITDERQAPFAVPGTIIGGVAASHMACIVSMGDIVGEDSVRRAVRRTLTEWAKTEIHRG